MCTNLCFPFSLTHDTTLPKCEGQCSCNRNISMYCLLCSRAFCSHCCNDTCVASTEKGSKSDTCNSNAAVFHKCVLVRYNTRTSAVEAVCESHDTWAQYLCCENQLICVYCKHRTRSKHTDQQHSITGKYSSSDIVSCSFQKPFCSRLY